MSPATCRYVRGNCGSDTNNTDTLAVLDSRNIWVNGVQLVPSGPGEGRYLAVILSRISGSISNVYVPITDQWQVVGVQANVTLGDLIIDNVVTEGGNVRGSGRSAGIEVTNAQTGRVTVKN